MKTVSRRQFLATLAAVPVAASLPALPVPVPQQLVFHPDAFFLAMEGPYRYDVIYGWAAIGDQKLSCRVIA